MITKDPIFVNSILRHPDVYPFISDDKSPSRNDFFVDPIKSNALFLSPNEYTLFILMPSNGVTWEIHTNILKPGRGKMADQSFRQMIEYMFTETECEKLISWVPSLYRNTLLFGLRNGLEKEGVSKKSWLKNGVLHDLILVGLTKENWKCQQYQH